MDVNSRDPSQNIIPFRIKGVEIGRFDSSGNLKIGTSTTLAPTVRLDISGGEARVNSGSVTSTALTTTGRIGVNVASPTVSLDVSGAAQITASSVVATALTTKGRIGINTTTPTSDLDVNGTVIMRSTLNLSNSLTLPTVFWHKSSDNVERLQYITSGNTIFKSGNGFLWYDSNNAVRMFLSNSGLLGIGHSSPAYALHIEGGAAYINSNSANNTALVTTGRIGVNTATPTVALEVNGLAKIGNVSIGANPLYAFTSHTFTNAGATGRTGPTLSTVRTTYTNAGATWAATNVNMTTNGIQLWTVPVSGTYTIRAVGAAGGNPGTFGRGRDIQTTTTLTKGEVIRILVGQQGVAALSNMGGGGGGTFVVRGTQTPIIVAGGGGGRGDTPVNQYVNSNASSATAGNKGGDGGGSNNGAGGTNGGGGMASAVTWGGGGGGGLLTDGTNSPPSSQGYGGASFINGGVGGFADANNSYGGFGGGGGSPAGGGGGGGYSGGGGGYDNWATGGGGGSFGITTLTDNGAINTDHGSVTITLLSTSSDFDISGVARMSASSATATALTTVGRIGVNIPDPMADLDVVGAARLTASSATATALTTTGRIGVNTATPTVDLEVNGLAKLGNVNIVPLYVFTSHTFTNAGITGRLGPTLTTVRNHSDYASVNWAQNNSYLSMTSDNGIQLWTVPLSGNYTIRAKGAAGLNTIGGKGRDIQLTTTLVKGEVIRILVGQQGTVSSGGGGTFVVRGTDTPIIVAGGGGGWSNVMTYPNQEPFSDASITTTGKATPYGYNGGSGGGGGISGIAGGISSQAAGGGFYGNGGGGGGGVSFTSGGAGGQGTNNGGFGGGGADLNYPGGAGGGGYSGGGAGGNILTDFGWANLGGGGGGSYGITTLTDFGAINTGHGSVLITLTTPSVALEVIGVAVVTGSSATATALTTTGRIGVNNTAPRFDLDVNGRACVTASSATATALTTTGRIGIGTDAPTCPLHVATVGANQNVYALGNVAYFNYGSATGIQSSTNDSPVSIISAGTLWVQGQHVWVSSDNRIKKNIVQLNSDRMMNIIRKIRPVSFNFINPSKNGSQTMFGFIAQDVKEHLPESIHYNIDVIPNNLMRGQIDNTSTITAASFTLKPDDGDISLNYVLLTTDSSLNFDTQNQYSSTNIYKFKIACWHEWSNEQDIFIHSEYRETNNKYTYVIGVKQEAYDILLKEPCIFVYGQYVYDLHILEHDTIWTVATAALQEVDRQQQADKTRITELEATVATQQSLINDILERLNKNGL